MKIGLDFDRVLFNTDKFDDFYKEQVEGLHHVENPSPVKHGVYDPEMHAELCEIPIERIWKVFENDISQFLYDDMNLLDELSRNHELVIVTRGNEKFQRKKIEASGITEKIEDFTVVQEEPKDSAGIDVLIDDRNYELERVEIPGIRIDRPKEGLKKVLEEVE